MKDHSIHYQIINSHIVEIKKIKLNHFQDILDILYLKIDDNPSLKDCRIISQIIHNEIQKNIHIIQYTPEQLYDISKQGMLITLKLDNQIIAFTKILRIETSKITLYEKGTLVVQSQYRQHKIGTIISQIIFQKNEDKLVYVVSNQTASMHISERFGLKRINPDKIPIHILECIEQSEKLLANEFIYVNKALYDYIFQFNKNSL